LNGKYHLKYRFRAPRAAGATAGDFAEVAFWVLKQHCGTGKKLSLEDVSSSLDRMAMKHANRDPS